MLEHDTVRRAARTFLQALVGAVLIALPAGLPQGWDATDWQLLGAGALYAGAVALVSFLHNELEDAGRLTDRRTPKSERQPR